MQLYLAASLAIYERLVGAPLDSKGVPLRGADGRPVNRLVVAPPGRGEVDANGVGRLPSYGIRISEPKAPYDTKHFLTSKTPDAVRLFSKGFDTGTFRQIPVFFENTEGRPWENVTPCVTFRLIGDEPRGSNYVYFDPICTPTGEDVDILNNAGDVIQTGKEDAILRPHPDGYDLIFLIRCYSRDFIQASLLADQIKYLFPQKGVLEVEQADGTKHPCDMLQDGAGLVRDPGGDEISMGVGAEGEGERWYSRAFRYRVEAYEDTTRNEFGYGKQETVPLITQRILQIENLQTGLLDKAVDLNLLEVSLP